MASLASTRKTVLISGLGRFGSSAQYEAINMPGEPSQLREQFFALVEQARDNGFDVDTEDVNPADWADTLRRVRERLQGKAYDCYIIGFGVRGNKQYTALFEQVVNLCVQVSPHTKFGFSSAPSEVLETMQRVLS